MRGASQDAFQGSCPSSDGSACCLSRGRASPGLRRQVCPWWPDNRRPALVCIWSPYNRRPALVCNSISHLIDNPAACGPVLLLPVLRRRVRHSGWLGHVEVLLWVAGWDAARIFMNTVAFIPATCSLVRVRSLVGGQWMLFDCMY